MGGSSKKPKQQVAQYHLSMHVGVCHSADAILRVKVNDKEAWFGEQTSNAQIPINRGSLFGGLKKEGGLRGLMHVLLGKSDQVLDNSLAKRLGGAGASGTSVPGFRGLTSLFFTGGGPEEESGFYWTANSAYLRPVDVQVRRAPGSWYPAKAMLPAITSTPAINGGILTESVTDARNLYPELNPENTSNPGWAENFSQTLGIGIFNYWSGDTGRQYYTPPGGDNAYIPGSPYPDNPGNIYSWALPPTDYTITFDYRWVLQLSWDGYDGLRWDNAWTSSDSVYQFPPNAPGCELRLIGSGGEDLLYIRIQSVTRPIGSPVGRTVQVLWQSARSGQSWSSSLTSPFSTWNLSLVFNQDSISLITASSTFSQSHTINVSPKEIVAVRYTALQGVRYQADVASGLFGGVLRVDGLNPISNPQDANPAHIIYECLTNTDWGLGLPDSMLDTASFVAAADTLYSEMFGLSMSWSSQTTIESFVNEVLTHVDGTYGVDPSSGKIFIKLIRGGYSTGSLFEVNEDNAVVKNFQRKALGETVNEVVVTWTNPDTENEETVVVHDLANYAQQGTLISNSSNYYGVRSRELALRLALRDLTRSAYPVASVDMAVNRTGWGFKPGDVIKLTYPELGLNGVPFRISSVNYGHPGDMRVQVSAIEDVFEMPSSAYVTSQGSDWVAPKAYWPSPFSRYAIGSMPFYLVTRSIGTEGALSSPVDQSYSMFVAGPDNSDTLTYEVLTPTTDALGQSYFTFDSRFAVCGRGVLTAALAREPLTTAVAMGSYFGPVPVTAQLAVIGDLSSNGELALVTGTGPVSLRRGVLDTSPRQWPVGTTVWFVDVESDLSSSSSYLIGSSGSFKLLPSTSLGTLDQDAAPTISATFLNRQHLPYRPANVRINSTFWPELIEGVSELAVTFSRRNRITEDPLILAWDAGDTLPEDDVTHIARLFRVDTGALLTSASGVTGTSVTLTNSSYNGQVRLQLTAIRGGLESFQPFTHTFIHAPAGVRSIETGELRITEDGQYRVMES